MAEVPLAAGTVAIGDLHLDPAGDARIERFVSFLADFDAPALVVLGDLFDVWVGPAQARMTGSTRVIDALAEVVRRGTRLLVVPGNRDFLLGRDFEERTGGTVHEGGFLGTGLLPVRATRVLFVHGDELCTRDRSYQRMKRVLRSGPARWIAPRLPLAAARWAAGRLRKASTRAVPRKPPQEKRMQVDACLELARRHAANLVVCGHAHAFANTPLGAGLRWIVLDAWGGRRDLVAFPPAGPVAGATRDWPASGTPVESPPMIVAIDGPAGSGKSTVARALATELGVAYLDTGAMYRAVTLVVQRRGIDPDDAQACVRAAEEITLDFQSDGSILIDGEPGEPAIRSREVTGEVSRVSAHAGVREAIVPKQRAIAEKRGAVAEGRDTTTVVFPGADHKFFLVASPAERARRRAEQEGRPEDREAILAEIEARDRADSTRAHSPLTQAADAIRVDTDGKDAAEVVQELLAHVR